MCYQMLNKGGTTNFSYHLGLDFNHSVHETQGPETLFFLRTDHMIFTEGKK